MAKHVYDRVQDAYDGEWDSAKKAYVGERRSFFTEDELYAIARAFEAQQKSLPSEAPASQSASA